MKHNRKSEFELIKGIREISPEPPSSILQGIGDDCTVIDPSFSRRLVFSSDLLVENVHFKRQWSSPFFLGRKALRVNLSDLAAMGAEPYLVLLDLALPPDCLDDFYQDFLRGFIQECVSSNTALAGGDFSRSTEISIALTVCGSITSGEALLRSGANPGDYIFVLGKLGLSSLGLDWLRMNAPSNLNKIEAEEELRRRIGSDPVFEQVKAHLLPTIHLQPGKWVREQSAASAMIDVSDGLALDLMHILEESGVGAKLDRDLLEEYRRLLPNVPLEAVLNGGEDYALLFTASPEQSQRIERQYPSALPSPFRIGRIIEGEPVIYLGSHGMFEPYQPSGYDHFR